MQVQVNSSGLLKNLSVMFSDGSKVLSELIQNGRRAGATAIHLDYIQPAEGETLGDLVVRDNGCGVADLQKLLSVAESGWNSETSEQESPYGMGAIAMLFACESVTIESGTQVFSFNCVNALTGAYLGEPQSRGEALEGCTITLHNYKAGENGLSHTLSKLARYSSVPIFFNGQELESDLSLQALSAHAATSDKVFVDTTELGTYVYSLCEHSVDVVLQDLLVARGSGYYYSLPSDGVRPTLFASNKIQARMPDRDQLIDSAKTRARIDEDFSSVVRQRLAKVRSQMNDDKAFVDKHFDVIAKYDRKQLNEIPYLPVTTLCGIHYPCARADYDNGFNVSTYDIPEGIDFVTPELGITLYNDAELMDYCDEPLAHFYLWGKTAFTLNCDLDKEHWVYAKMLSLKDKEFGVIATTPSEPVQVTTANFEMQNDDCALLVDTLEVFALDNPADKVLIPHGLFIQDTRFYFDTTKECYREVGRFCATPQTVDMFIVRDVAESCDGTQALLMQFFGYDYNDEWQDSLLEQDTEHFMAQVDALCGKDLPDILARFLNEAPKAVRETMLNHKFQVALNEQGLFEVKAA